MSTTNLITNGTVKVFTRGDDPVDITDGTLTPVIVTPANTDADTYKFSDLDEGKYTYAASAPGKGVKVGEFVLPDPNAEEGVTTKAIGPIRLTSGIEPVKLILTDKDDAVITTDIRALVAGIDTTHDAMNAGTWQIVDPLFVPTNLSTKIQIIPDNVARAAATKALLQNLKLWKPISDAYKEHTIKIYPPIKIFVNVFGKLPLMPNEQISLNDLANTKVEIVMLDSNGAIPEGEAFVQIFSSVGQGFMLTNACNGTYRVRVSHTGVYKSKVQSFIAEWSTESDSVLIDVLLDLSDESGLEPVLDRTYKVYINPSYNKTLVTDAEIKIFDTVTSQVYGPKWIDGSIVPEFALKDGSYQAVVYSETRGSAVSNFTIDGSGKTIEVVLGHQI